MEQLEIPPINPNRLKLIWQSNGPDRNKYTVGEIIRSGENFSLSYFYYKPEFAQARIAGFEGHPAFQLSKPVHHNNVIEVLARRLPSRSRNDFYQYLQKYRLSIDTPATDMALLGYTGAFLPSDGFSFAIDWRFEETPYVFMMEVSGFRYNAGMHIDMDQMRGQYLSLVAEPENEFDPNAIALYLNDQRIGYVPRYYAPDILNFSRYFDVFCRIERIDGAMAKPKVHVLTTITARQHEELNRLRKATF